MYWVKDKFSLMQPTEEMFEEYQVESGYEAKYDLLISSFRGKEL